MCPPENQNQPESRNAYHGDAPKSDKKKSFNPSTGDAGAHWRVQRAPPRYSIKSGDHSARLFDFQSWAVSDEGGLVGISHDAVIRVYDESGNVIQTHEHKGDFKEWYKFS